MARKNINFSTGYVGLAGRPNVGKSSLMNQFIGTQVSIVTKRKQTTRNPVLGIFSSTDCQIIFLDNPGIDFKNSLLLNKRLKKIAFSNVVHTNINIVILEATKLLVDDRKILENMPEELEIARRKIMRLEIEHEALKKETKQTSRTRSKKTVITKNEGKNTKV